jgi:hypothetical protein
MFSMKQNKKMLKILQGLSKAVNPLSTDISMARRKKKKLELDANPIFPTHIYRTTHFSD